MADFSRWTWHRGQTGGTQETVSPAELASDAGVGDRFERPTDLKESRRGVRYPVELDCRVSTRSDPKRPSSGRTVNVSRCGVLVSFDRGGSAWVRPEVGDPARVMLELPNASQIRGCCVECMCRVARVHDRPGAHSVAFDVVRYRFRPFPRRPPAEGQTGLA